ncbi:MAG: glycoside hydrolase family 9 protein [Tannerella sp.]|jgi:hypothetical protein|nr:glycoside hydrolase family 9 protein [Tannerella sp.]
MRKIIFYLLIGLLTLPSAAREFRINSSGYFQNYGANVMVFSDVYPEGHQGGITFVMNSLRLAANGDIRFEVSPGQWQGLPKMRERIVDETGNQISVTLSYPDSAKHKTGFNPMLYPDFVFNYTITVKGEGNRIRVRVDLDTPVPERFAEKIGFNLELFPGILTGKPWIMDQQTGIFPTHPYGPTMKRESTTKHLGDFNPDGKADVARLLGDGTYSPMVADDIFAAPFARGKQFVLNPEDPYRKITFESSKGDLVLYDGRMNHNNGWFILRTEIPAGVSQGAVEWVITPEIQEEWMYTPVVQTSQIGYHPGQPKVAVIELDEKDTDIQQAILHKITAKGKETVLAAAPESWGKFLRYNYLHFDFSQVKEEGIYQVTYGNSASNIFRIANNIYDWGVWQPMLEYFLPVQMCHMRINEKYRVWHDLCHMDDAKMAQVDLNHIDGYVQGPSTLTKYKPGEIVPGLNVGGWHDAGDYDLRIESQAGETYILTLAQENFKIDYWDETTVDQQKRVTEIHQPDGKPDILQQIEHGALSIVAGYQALGRLYRGILCPTVRQYTHLGDASAHTDNHSGNEDDRWVFTEDNPRRELTTAAQLAAASRVLNNYNDTLSTHCLDIAKELYQITRTDDRIKSAKIHAAVELYLTTNANEYKDYVLSEQKYIVENIDRCWFIGRFDRAVNNKKFSEAIRKALPKVAESYKELASRSPYGLPPDRGNRTSGSWDVQTLGYYYTFFQDAYPDIFAADYIFNAVNFILGCHPGSNTTSFVSGVGARSATVAYGVNRGDWSHIPGGVIPGTVLIRPDLPELYDFPFIWQEGEYCMGGEASYFMYMVLAAQKILNPERVH